MADPFRCRDESRPSRDELTSALARALEEIDSYRDMLDLPGFNCNRVFSPTDLSSGSVIGLRVEMLDGSLACHPDS